MDVHTQACNVCGQQKTESHHWFVAITRPGYAGIIFQPAETVETPRRPEFTYEDICGETCCLKRHSRWLDSLKTAATTTQESEAA